MNEVSYIAAFTTGLLTFFAPCTFVTLPAFLTYITSQMVKDLDDGSEVSRFMVFKSALAYVFGFLLIFILLGVTAFYLGNVLLQNKDILIKVGGGVMVIGGLFMLFGDRVRQLQFMFREQKIHLKTDNRLLRSYLFPFLIGVTAALAWTPCVGPVLGSILFLAGASSENPLQGGLLLLVHGLGITIPFLILALMFDRASGFVKKFTKYSKILYKVSAFVLIILGLTMLTGTFDHVQKWVYTLFHRFGYEPR